MLASAFAVTALKPVAPSLDGSFPRQLERSGIPLGIGDDPQLETRQEALAPGDMLFWASRGRIHHVALYIGNNRMIEAPRKGLNVRVTSVRYGGIVSYATRLL